MLESPSSFYINQIEQKMKALGLPLDHDAYNDIFREKDDRIFIRRLRIYNEILNKMADLKSRGVKHA